MNLNRALPDDLKKLLPEEFRTEAQGSGADAADNKQIHYATPFDLSREGDVTHNSWLAVTRERLAVFRDGKLDLVLMLNELSDLRLENTGDGGYIYAVAKPGTDAARQLNGADTPAWICRFSKRYLIQMSYIARGIQLFIAGDDRIVESKEKERYCDTCGRALPGTAECPHCDKSHQTWNRLVQLSRDYWKPLFMIMLPVLFITFIGIGERFIERYFIDNVLLTGEGTGTQVLIFFLVMLSVGALSIVSIVLRTLWTNRLGTRISQDLRQKVYYKLNELQLAFIDRFEAGELMDRVIHDTDRIRRFIEMVFGEMLNLLVTIVAITIVMFVINWRMALLTVVMFPLAMMVVRFFRKKEIRLWRQQWRYRDRVTSRLQDVIQGIRVVKSFGQEERESKRFGEEADRLRDLTRRNELFWATLYPFVTFIVTAGSILITGYGGFEVLGGRLTVGELNQMIAYAGMMYGPLGFLTRLPRMLIMLNTSMDRIYDILDEPIEFDEGNIVPDGPISGEIVLDNISFGYNSYEPVLQNISATIKAGEKIGIVGSSGSGKSTLINLLMKLYLVDEGQIRVDGEDIRELYSNAFHRQLGIVLQESFLFSGTILDNIRYADQDADLESVMEAARLANAHDFITRFPDGYDTYVGESGGRLSGGEKQRIAIARAILHNPSMLILDEPTSSLDLETEVLIQDALDRLTEGKTTFTIAHRLSTLKSSDRIMVIDNHGIAEFGSHNELMEQEGIYHGLVQAQLELHKVKESAIEVDVA